MASARTVGQLWMDTTGLVSVFLILSHAICVAPCLHMGDWRTRIPHHSLLALGKCW